MTADFTELRAALETALDSNPPVGVIAAAPITQRHGDVSLRASFRRVEVYDATNRAVWKGRLIDSEVDAVPVEDMNAARDLVRSTLEAGLPGLVLRAMADFIEPDRAMGGKQFVVSIDVLRDGDA